MKDILAYLGPEGTFSHKAALCYTKDSQMTLLPCKSLFDVIDTLDKDKSDFAIVPVENSTEGSISIVLDEIVSRKNINIFAEFDISVILNLMVKPDCIPEKITEIYSHYQPIAQCQNTVKKLFPEAELIPLNSTAKAADMVSNDQNCKAAAIGTDLAAEIYSLKIIHHSINDFKNNKTRFIVLSKKQALAGKNNKTSIAFTARADKPGSLYNILGIFAEKNVNLTKIESRPTKETIGTYIFFIDFEGHISDPTIMQVIEKVKENTISLRILGSYNILEGDVDA